MEWVSEKILKYLDYDGGIYIESGANDGVTQSNTYYLEKNKGWSGILIEPSVSSFELCKENRSENNIFLNCALVSNDYDSDYIEGDFDGNLMSSVNGNRRNNIGIKIKTKAKKLSDILNENNLKKIDFFSLDVEGYEYEVLKGIDFNSHEFKFLLIEIYKWDYKKIVDLLNTNGYELIENLSGFNLDNNPYWDGTHNDYLFKKI
jgi:FkbM family methyltransferase